MYDYLVDELIDADGTTRYEVTRGRPGYRELRAITWDLDLARACVDHLRARDRAAEALRTGKGG